jgi:hypothetical protein
MRRENETKRKIKLEKGMREKEKEMIQILL